jgi:hypothetical protein
MEVEAMVDENERCGGCNSDKEPNAAMVGAHS